MLKSGKFWKEGFSKPTLSSARGGRECGRRNFMKFLRLFHLFCLRLYVPQSPPHDFPRQSNKSFLKICKFKTQFFFFFFFFFAKCCSCNCLKIKMTFEVPYSCIKPICISSISTVVLPTSQ